MHASVLGTRTPISIQRTLGSALGCPVLAQSWWRSAYTLNVAAFSTLLSFFQRSHLSGRRLKSSSAHTFGAELFGLREILRPGRVKLVFGSCWRLIMWLSLSRRKKLFSALVPDLRVLGGHSTSCVLHAAAGLTLRWEEVCSSFECCWMFSLNTFLYSF